MLTNNQYTILHDLLADSKLHSLADVNNKQILFYSNTRQLIVVKEKLLRVFPILKIIGESNILNKKTDTLTIFDTEKITLSFIAGTLLNTRTQLDTIEQILIDRTSLAYERVGGDITVFPEVVFKNTYDKTKPVYSGFYKVNTAEDFINLFNNTLPKTLVHVFIKEKNIGVTIEINDEYRILFNVINIIVSARKYKSTTLQTFKECFEVQNMEQIIINNIIFGR